MKGFKAVLMGAVLALAATVAVAAGNLTGESFYFNSLDSTPTLGLSSDAQVNFTATTGTGIGTKDTGFRRSAAGTLQVTTGSTTNGALQAASAGPTSAQQHTLPAVTSDTFALLDATQTLTAKTLTSPTIASASLSNAALTTATMTRASSAIAGHAVHKFTWTNAMVVAAAGTSNKINVCTLPAKTIVKRVYVVVDTAATQAATLTISVGPSTDTDGYVVASNAKASANTVYGDGIAEQGALLFVPGDTDDYHLEALPSYTTTTSVQAEFTIGAGTLADATASTGSVFLETLTLP